VGFQNAANADDRWWGRSAGGVPAAHDPLLIMFRTTLRGAPVAADGAQ
jgi:hypothetical protein